MGIFQGGCNDTGQTQQGLRHIEKCKKDYEGMIARVRKAKDSSTDFLIALYAFTKDNCAPTGETFTIAELIGRLELELRRLGFEIENLIRAQEADKG